MGDLQDVGLVRDALIVHHMRVVPDLLDERGFIHAIFLEGVRLIDEVASDPYYLTRDQ